MEQGTIGRWLVHEGDAIAEGDVIAEIETDKATMEFQAYADGTVLKILVGDGETRRSGRADRDRRRARRGGAREPQKPDSDADAQASGCSRSRAPASRLRRRSRRHRRAAQSGNGAVRRRRCGSSPIARRMADAAGIDLGRLAGRGSGPDGRIVKVDVERLLAERHGAGARPAQTARRRRRSAPPSPAADEVRELTPMLKAVAHRMAESKATVPHFYVTVRNRHDAGREMRAELNEALADRGEKISLNDLIVRACAMALLDHPQAHRSYVDGRHVYHAHANVGIAVALDDGLIVPVVREADTKSVPRSRPRPAIWPAVRAAAASSSTRSRAAPSPSPTWACSTCPSSRRSSTRPSRRSWRSARRSSGRSWWTARWSVRSIMAVTLACDHRACSGADGARLLQTITAQPAGAVAPARLSPRPPVQLT